jgi:SAM-dependent methyltransferase
MFPIFRRAGLRVSGIDISDAMIAQCRQGWGAEAFIDRIEAAEAETLPFADSAFDNLACLAVFDATFQDRALAEFMRVLAPGGHLYLTGKNATYHDDDALAFDAEVGARRKGHPNFFTDAPEMLRQLAAGGHTVVAGYYFARRGDFAEFRHVRELPDSFYEYLLVVHRGTGPAVFTEFSSAFSKTFQKRTGTG